eukprot:TRINITY_DN6843_c0_g1_i1.p1 TRINITY_DN6843_c0_g1~~TRINITY_DN6843_c0_g1_i1.p1  ORF type:complete len:659 (-),score=44.91 TRINITY_DN6843_c0_g1_i1:898-2874(-)
MAQPQPAVVGRTDTARIMTIFGSARSRSRELAPTRRSTVNSRLSSAVTTMFWQRSRTPDLAATKSASLTSRLDADMLRAAQLHEALAGFGKHWSTSPILSCDVTASEYELSQPVTEIDDFLSHDWGTPRFAKLIALLHLYNHKDAALASGLLGLPIAAVAATQDLPLSARYVCPFIWLMVYVFGQHWGRIIGQPGYVFLDRLCIHQTDPARKSAGILALAAFLKASNRLVVLWSPRYFTRLWCTYELAAWSHLRSEESQAVAFLPVMRAAILLRVTVTLTLAYWARHVFAVAAATSGWLAFWLVNVVLIVAACNFLAGISDLVSELGDMKQQIEGFSMRDAKCFCCTHNHIHPETGQEMACDRRLVYKALAKWWVERASDGSEDVEQVMPLSSAQVDVAVDEFNQQVQRSLLTVLGKTTNWSLVFCTYQDVVCAWIPIVWTACDGIATFAAWRNPGMAIRWTLEYVSLWLFVAPLACAFTFQSASCLHKRRKASLVGAIHPIFLKALTVCTIGLVAITSFFFLWFPGPILVALHQEGYPLLGDIAMVVRIVLLSLLTLRVFCLSSCGTCHRPSCREQEQDAEHWDASASGSQPADNATDDDGSRCVSSMSTDSIHETVQVKENIASAPSSTLLGSGGCGRILNLSFQDDEARVLKMSV